MLALDMKSLFLPLSLLVFGGFLLCRTVQNRCLRQLNYFCESDRERRGTGGLQLPNARAAPTGAEDASNPEAHIEQIM